MSVSFILNGEPQEFQGDGRTSLLSVLRETCCLTGSKAVCGEGFCGACTILVDGEPAVACLKAVGTMEGKHVLTIEGASYGGKLSPVQEALEKHDVVQCGMCFPGIVMTFTHLLEENPNPSRDEVKTAMVGNLCRCTGYERIVDAVLSIPAEQNIT